MGWSWSVSGVSWRWDCWMRCLLLCCCAVLIMAEVSEQQPNTVEAIAFQPSMHKDYSGFKRITVYWRMIPKIHKIDTFHYAVHVYSNQTLLDIEPSILTNTWARFTNLKKNESYTFRIYAADKMGNSRGYDEITVPPIYELMEGPMATAWICGNRRYHVEWFREPEWTGYTIFWCTARDYDCNGYLNWVRVDGDTEAKFIDVEEEGPHQFFVAANIDNSTGGLRLALMLDDIISPDCYKGQMGVTTAPDEPHSRTYDTGDTPDEPHSRTYDTSDTPDKPYIRTDYNTSYTSSSSSYSGKLYRNLFTTYFYIIFYIYVTLF